MATFRVKALLIKELLINQSLGCAGRLLDEINGPEDKGNDSDELWQWCDAQVTPGLQRGVHAPALTAGDFWSG